MHNTIETMIEQIGEEGLSMAYEDEWVCQKETGHDKEKGFTFVEGRGETLGDALDDLVKELYD